jgi:halimadienyl-diphosphate synthase
MDEKTFRILETERVAELTRQKGPKVCVFPINGTRRWFLLEHPSPNGSFESRYFELAGQRHIELYKLLFDHGIETLLTPIFGKDLLNRGAAYVEVAARGLEHIATGERFLDFYDSYDVRVRFYGDYRKHFADTTHAYLCDLFDELTERTHDHMGCRLFLGVFADDPAETIAELSVEYARARGGPPDKETLIALYYGEPVPPVDIFIGFDKFAAFDMPLIASGTEDLYFTVTPSLYLDEEQLRGILYDHMYTRREDETDYADLTAADWQAMRRFYEVNRGKTLGVGARYQPGNFWYPLPQVKIPGEKDDKVPSLPELRRESYALFHKITPGESRFSNTVYDTAWLARLIDVDEELGRPALEWLAERQLPDGSWGAEAPHYHYDRLICTLSALTALEKFDCITPTDNLRAQIAIEREVRGLFADPAGETIGFEMIAPTLMNEARRMIRETLAEGELEHLIQMRNAKLAALPAGKINRYTTVAFSAEMAGEEGAHLVDIENLQEANGSVGHSPSATAYFAAHVVPGDPAALAYLREVTIDGAAQLAAPSDVFEIGWVLWNFIITDAMDERMMALAKPFVDYLEMLWRPGRGASLGNGYTPEDGDDTSLVYETLRRFGREPDLEGVLRWEEDMYFRCFEIEANPSLGANVHALGALRHAGLSNDHPTVQKVVTFLQRTKSLQLFWFDKWHSSPYYTTAHAIIAGTGYVDYLVESSIDWLLETQRLDGSWGYYMRTAEETAYALQGLMMWKRFGNPVPEYPIRKGIEWLAAHMDGPYPPLWIGKCLYSPDRVVRSAILSALLMARQFNWY